MNTLVVYLTKTKKMDKNSHLVNSKTSRKNTRKNYYNKSTLETNDLEDMSLWTKVFLFVLINVIVMIFSYFFLDEV